METIIVCDKEFYDINSLHIELNEKNKHVLFEISKHKKIIKKHKLLIQNEYSKIHELKKSINENIIDHYVKLNTYRISILIEFIIIFEEFLKDNNLSMNDLFKHKNTISCLYRRILFSILYFKFHISLSEIENSFKFDHSSISSLINTKNDFNDRCDIVMNHLIDKNKLLFEKIKVITSDKYFKYRLKSISLLKLT